MFTVEEVREITNEDIAIIKEFFSKYWSKGYPEHYRELESIIKAKSYPGSSYKKRIYYLMSSNSVAGLLIVDKDLVVQKLKFLAVKEAYRKLGGGTDLLNVCFELLQTNYPEVDIPADAVDSFKYIIKKYGWCMSNKYTNSIGINVFQMNEI